MRKDVLFHNRVIFCVLFLCFFVAVSIHSDAQSAQAAQNANPDTRYAERYLLLAQDCFAKEAWENAAIYAKQGLEYDAGISDLWYVLAAASAQSGRNIHDVLPLIETAYNTNRWIGNKDGARIFLRICSTLPVVLSVQWKRLMQVLQLFLPMRFLSAPKVSTK
ncbi:MAG: hypothetical protein Ta2A_24060 [Treponemataceae bacterium]|nr:MAG: hypothetical protein Ta2A_24060 [Treponemataceae bacterium]